MQDTSQQAAGVYGSIVRPSIVVMKPYSWLVNRHLPALVLNPWRKYVASIFGYVTRNRSKPRRHFHLRKEPGRRQSNRACLDDVVRTRSMYLCRSEECIISLYRETPLRSMQCSLFPNYCLPLSIHSYQGSDKTAKRTSSQKKRRCRIYYITNPRIPNIPSFMLTSSVPVAGIHTSNASVMNCCWVATRALRRK